MAVLDWKKYLDKAAEVNAEGIVMLKNDGALPLSRDEETAVFGRIQLNYYKSGTGSGGMVNVSKVTGIVDGLIDAGAKLNTGLLDIYKKWTEENPFDLGEGWGGEPWCQEEMPLSDDIVRSAAETSSAAVVIIGRTAGEEQDNSNTEGSYLLTQAERDMMRIVRKHFSRMIVLLNVGNIIDMSFVDEFSPEAVLYVWQGGMTGGTGAARVLLGDVSPSGCLPDTIAMNISDYPSDKYFYNTERNYYTEDIYVGYRYFQTFAKDKVRYPFGFGLSYTDFDISAEGSFDGNTVTVKATIKNTGSYKGKKAVQVYAGAPDGKLGKAARVLCAFDKTRELSPNESQTIVITIDKRSFASYDDSGATGHPYAWLLEEGVYSFYIGGDVSSAEQFFTFELSETEVLEQLEQALAPVAEFDRMVRRNGGLCFEKAPISKVDENKRRLNEMVQETAFTGDKGIKLIDAAEGRNSIDEFAAQLTDEELNCLVRGEGMCSPKVTPGTAAAFGGVSDSLKNYGIPCGCCSDGPSGMRLDVGTKAFSLPNGTLIAATFNKKLVTELFEMLGLEMRANNVDCLLGPGMNIHRHPLNGRNFEYFSEDPFLTGSMAVSELKGLHSMGVEGTVKHFCGNNQETNRHFLDAAVSERALREIYLKGFEMAVKEGKGRSVMTTYGKVNDLWTAGSYDLLTKILREQWGFDGFVMTDWWANINERGQGPDKNNFAAMLRAQNDVYMVCADGSSHTDNTMSALKDGRLTRGELQRSAKNILSFLTGTHAMKRLAGTDEAVTVTNRPADISDENKGTDLFILNDELTIDLRAVKTAKGADYSFTLDVKDPGMYDLTLTASSEKGELAQMPVTLFALGTAITTFTFNGTGGEPVSFSAEEVPFFSRYTILRMHFGLGGLDLISLTLKPNKDVKFRPGGISAE